MNNSALISTVFRKEVLELAAYKVANAQGYIKLDAMENPYSWPEEIQNQWLEHLKDCQLNRYPDPEAVQPAVSYPEQIRESPPASSQRFQGETAAPPASLSAKCPPSEPMHRPHSSR